MAINTHRDIWTVLVATVYCEAHEWSKLEPLGQIAWPLGCSQGAGSVSMTDRRSSKDSNCPPFMKTTQARS